MTKKEKRIQRILEKIQNQPEFIANAVGWLLTHLVLIEAICDPNDRLSDEIIEREMKRATEEGDYVYYALLLYQQYAQDQKEAEDTPLP